MQVLVTSAITVGTALVGAFGEGAAIFRKGGVTVEATNSHGTYFASDITTIRAELRLALGVFRPSRVRRRDGAELIRDVLRLAELEAIAPPGFLC